MKTLMKVFVCAMALVIVPSLAHAQVGYSVADFNGTQPQRLYRFDVNVGIMEDLGTIETNTEQEGLFSVGSLLFGYSEYDPALATLDERQPGTRILPWPGAANVPNLAGSPPNVNQRVCATGTVAQFGTESGAGYNPVDGFVYVVNSNDDPTVGTVGSRFIRFKPGCNSVQQIGPDNPLYVDGVAVDGQGNVYMSDFRLQDRIYRFNTTTGALTPIGSLGFPINRDSGLAWDFENDRLIGLAENGVLYTINTTTGAATLLSTLTLNGGPAPVDLEGFDIPVADPIP